MVKLPVFEFSELVEKFNKNHDAKTGKFTSVGGTIVEGKVVDLRETGTWAEHGPDIFIKSRDQGDLYLRKLVRDQGFDGLPHVVSEKRLDEYVKAGEIELYRGCGRTVHLEQFRSGEYYAGNGVYGNGIYASSGSTARDDASSYADLDGHVLRMTIKAGAKIGLYREIVAEGSRAYGEMTAKNRQTHREVEDRLKSITDPDERRKVWEHEEKRFADEEAYIRALTSDVGRYAILKGYDGYRIDPYHYYNILNRTALRVQDTDVIVQVR
jgi:hypothetical protein